MLSDPTITAFLPTMLPEQSKQFYLNILGLQLVSEDAYALEFKGKGCILRITMVQELIPQPFTVLGFKINDIDSQVKSLTDKGIIFEKYNNFVQSELGIWMSPSGAKVAWFKDPDGNILSLTEYPR